MMRRWLVLVLAVAAAMIVAPAEGSAQGRGKARAAVVKQGGPPSQWGRDRDGGWDPRRDQDRDDDWGRDTDRDDDRDRDGRWDDRLGDDRGRGPAFCRSGAGHPVHGRRWCVHKGFGLGDRDRRRDSLEDIINGIPRRDPREESRSRATVIDILEDVLGNR